MFGWIKKQRLREQYKLLYQNSMSTKSLSMIFRDMGRLAEGDANFGQAMEYVGQAEAIEALCEQVRKIALDIKPGEFASHEQMEALFEINRTMRRVYDGTASKYVQSFDKNYTPIGGWKFYYAMREAE